MKVRDALLVTVVKLLVTKNLHIVNIAQAMPKIISNDIKIFLRESRIPALLVYMENEKAKQQHITGVSKY